MYNLRSVKEKDASTLRFLAVHCAPLDVHTPYTYWVAANYYGEGCFILEDDENPIGFIMAVETASSLFVWQIGILLEYRGKGLSKKLIEAVFDYATQRQKNMEVTIAEDNIASYSAFSRFCNHKNIRIDKVRLVEVRDLENLSFKENEIMYSIKVL